MSSSRGMEENVEKAEISIVALHILSFVATITALDVIWMSFTISVPKLKDPALVKISWVSPSLVSAHVFIATTAKHLSLIHI